MHPEAVKLATQAQGLAAQAYAAYRRLEDHMLVMRAKGLAPDEDGVAPEGWGVDPLAGTIGGNVSTILAEDVALLFPAGLAVGQAMGSPLLDTGRTVEEQLMRSGVG